MNIELTIDEINALLPRLEKLLKEANGVDVWLAPGGVLDVNEGDSDCECFLDADDKDIDHLYSISEKLMAHTYIFVVHVTVKPDYANSIQIKDPIVGTFTTMGKAIDAVEDFANSLNWELPGEETDTSSTDFSHTLHYPKGDIVVITQQLS